MAQAGERLCAAAPQTPGVYVLRDEVGSTLYVGKATNLRRRLRAHFARRRWRMIKPELAHAAQAEWQEVGSEIEALVREAQWIRELTPPSTRRLAFPRSGPAKFPSIRP